MLKKFLLILLTLGLLIGGLWAFLDAESQESYPVIYGISFNQHHAAHLALDWKQVYVDMLDELQPTYVRVAAMWDEVENTKGEYQFENVDFMMDEAAKRNTKVTLVVGQKAPRWPECHIPTWLDYGQEASKAHLLSYVEATVDRYQNHPALHMWQVENEAFIEFKFGECDGFVRDYIYDEIAIVRSTTPETPILVTDSGELGLWRKAAKTGDVFGTTLYRITRTPSGRIVTYDYIPPAFYRYKAKLTGVDLDNFIVAELQGEPWFNDSNPLNTPIEEQELTMNPERLQAHLEYVERIGVDTAYLWGVEWWYYMKQERDDARYWELIQDHLQTVTID